jgi:DNA-binding transcriptional LysR family regulator
LKDIHATTKILAVFDGKEFDRAPAVMENAVSRLLRQGKLIDLFPDWPDERFPFYAVYSSRKHLPAKPRAFLDFVVSLPSSGTANVQD